MDIGWVVFLVLGIIRNAGFGERAFAFFPLEFVRCIIWDVCCVVEVVSENGE